VAGRGGVPILITEAASVSPSKVTTCAYSVDTSGVTLISTSLASSASKVMSSGAACLVNIRVVAGPLITWARAGIACRCVNTLKCRVWIIDAEVVIVRVICGSYGQWIFCQNAEERDSLPKLRPPAVLTLEKLLGSLFQFVLWRLSRLLKDMISSES
jgi:hypothetical protein